MRKHARIIYDPSRRKFLIPPGSKNVKWKMRIPSWVHGTVKCNRGNVIDKREFAGQMNKSLHAFKIKLINILNDPTVRVTMRVVNDVSEAVKTFKPRDPWTWVQAGSKVCVSLVDHLEVDEYMYFEADRTWSSFFPKEFSQTIRDAVSDCPSKVIRTSTQGKNIRLVNLGDDVTIGWVQGTIDREATIWTPTSQMPQAQAKVTEILWRRFANNSVVVNNKSREWFNGSNSGSSECMTFEVDDTAKFMTSGTAKKHAQYLSHCMACGVKRTVLYYGPPGTGKTTMVQTMVKALGLRSFRFSVDNMSTMDNNTLLKAIQIFKPDVVIIDDIDRIGNDTSLFEFMTSLKDKVQFVLATANRPSQLDEGILRPGRFDELVAVTKLDDEVTRFLLGQEYADVFDDVKDFPIAYIEEYKTQRKLRPAEDALHVLHNMRNRVKRLSEFYDELVVDETTGQATIAPKRSRKKRNKFMGSKLAKVTG